MKRKRRAWFKLGPQLGLLEHELTPASYVSTQHLYAVKNWLAVLGAASTQITLWKFFEDSCGDGRKRKRGGTQVAKWLRVFRIALHASEAEVAAPWRRQA